MYRVTFTYEDGKKISIDREQRIDDHWWNSVHSQQSAQFTQSNGNRTMIRLHGCRMIQEKELTTADIEEKDTEQPKEEKPAKRPYKRRGSASAGEVTTHGS